MRPYSPAQRHTLASLNVPESREALWKMAQEEKNPLILASIIESWGARPGEQNITAALKKQLAGSSYQGVLELAAIRALRAQDDESAVPDVLARFPLLNASLDDATQEIVLHPQAHLGVATATELPGILATANTGGLKLNAVGDGFGHALLLRVGRAHVGLAALLGDELLDLRPEDLRLVLGDLDAHLVDRVLDDLEDLLGDLLGEDLEGSLERVDGVDQVDVELVDVDELARHQDEALVADLLDFAVLDDGVDDDGLADLLDLGRAEIGVGEFDDLRHEDLVHDLGVDVAADHLTRSAPGESGGAQAVEAAGLYSWTFKARGKGSESLKVTRLSE